MLFLENDVIYFKNADDVAGHLSNIKYEEITIQLMFSNNKKKICEVFDWEIIVNQYANHFKEILKEKKVKSL